MKVFRKVLYAAFAIALAAGGAEMGGRLGVTGLSGFLNEAHAVVGRPLTPVSVAAWRAGPRPLCSCVYSC